MKLAIKFALSFVLITVLIWGISSYLRVKREINLFEKDIRRDHESVGADLAAAVADIWGLGGEEAAIKFVNQANESKGNIFISLVALDSTASESSSPIYGALNALSNSDYKGIFHLNIDSIGKEWLYSYIAVPNVGGHHYAIELVESLEEKNGYVRSTILRTIFYISLVSVLAGIIILVLGVVFVARPIKSLIDKARRVAEGDFSGRIGLNQNDELSELGIELNAMSDRLAGARRQISLESSARQATLEQLRHADRLTTVGKLASAVAHELGTPLNVIKARARMISEREVEGEEAIESSQIIVGQSTRMAEIIRGLLDLSRRREPQKEQVDLRLVISQTVELIEALARKNRISIERKLGADLINISIDPDQIRQVLSNLIMNAMEAMPNGGTMTVALSKKTDYKPTKDLSNDYAVISVTDTGSGILPQNFKRVFDPFFTTKDRQTGTGLGLSISADIIREHGGWIEIDSEVDKGTRLSVFLPVS